MNNLEKEKEDFKKKQFYKVFIKTEKGKDQQRNSTKKELYK